MIEVLITFFILLIIADGAWTIYKNTVDTNTTLSYDLMAQSEARHAFEEMSAGLRSASASSIGTYAIDSASSTAFIYYADVNRDGLMERIRYFKTKSTLKKGVIIPSGSPLTYNSANEKITELVHDLINDPANPIFSYYDSGYDGTTAPLTYPINLLAIRLVKINFILDHNVSKPPPALTFTTQISLRNLKDNL